MSASCGTHASRRIASHCQGRVMPLASLAHMGRFSCVLACAQCRRRRPRRLKVVPSIELQLCAITEKSGVHEMLRRNRSLRILATPVQAERVLRAHRDFMTYLASEGWEKVAAGSRFGLAQIRNVWFRRSEFCIIDLAISSGVVIEVSRLDDCVAAIDLSTSGAGTPGTRTRVTPPTSPTRGRTASTP